MLDIYIGKKKSTEKNFNSKTIRLGKYPSSWFTSQMRVGKDSVYYCVFFLSLSFSRHLLQLGPGQFWPVRVQTLTWLFGCRHDFQLYNCWQKEILMYFEVLIPKLLSIIIIQKYCFWSEISFLKYIILLMNENNLTMKFHVFQANSILYKSVIKMEIKGI